jgi:hypothetical protein
MFVLNEVEFVSIIIKFTRQIRQELSWLLDYGPLSLIFHVIASDHKFLTRLNQNFPLLCTGNRPDAAKLMYSELNFGRTLAHFGKNLATKFENLSNMADA